MSIHNVLHKLANANWNLLDPGSGVALSVDQTGIYNIVTGASGETNTLGAPLKEGVIIGLNLLTDGGGDRVITVSSAFDQHSSTTITLATAGDFVLLQSVKFGSGFRWRVLSRQLAADPSPSELDALDGLTATVTELNKLDDSAAILTQGSGIAGIETYASGVFREGDLIVTRILVDLTGLVVDDADLDIIGDDDAANCHFGQITAALNGTIVGGRMTCLEVPAGAGTVDDIDLYSATVGTGQEGVATGIASLEETALVTSGAAWTSGRTLGFTAVPAANEFLYLVAGAAGGDSSAFTAGKFLIELFGTP